MDDNELRALAHRVRDHVEGGVDLDTDLDRAITASKRDRVRNPTWAGIAGVAAGLVVAVAAVSLVTRGGGDDVLRSLQPAPVEVSTPDTDVSTSTSAVDETSPIVDVPGPTSAPVATNTECQGVPSGGDLETGGFGTILAAPDASSLAVSITSQARGGCPLDEVDVVIDVTNTGNEVVAFASELGVLLSAGPTKWSVGAPEEMKLAPGETRSQTVSIRIPDGVAPGTYALLVAGYEASTPFVVYVATSDTTAVLDSTRRIEIDLGDVTGVLPKLQSPPGEGTITSVAVGNHSAALLMGEPTIGPDMPADSFCLINYAVSGETELEQGRGCGRFSQMEGLVEVFTGPNLDGEIAAVLLTDESINVSGPNGCTSDIGAGLRLSVCLSQSGEPVQLEFFSIDDVNSPIYATRTDTAGF